MLGGIIIQFYIAVVVGNRTASRAQAVPGFLPTIMLQLEIKYIILISIDDICQMLTIAGS